jgi:probable HAF family extracellular repeat protein
MLHTTSATHINSSAQITGYRNIDPHEGFLYSNGTYTTITAPGGGLTFLEGINDAGQIVGYTYASPSFPLSIPYVTSFLYSGGSFTSVRDPQEVPPSGRPSDPRGTFAQDINNAGQIVGYYTGSGGIVHGFFFSGGTYTTLDDPLGTRGTYATGINNAGQIVGYFIDVNGGIHGFVYSGGAYTTIDDPSATGGTYVYGINDVGQIVGTWVDVSNNRHGFLGTLPNPPPPAGTTADMILRRADGMYEIYDIGNNTILGAFRLGQVGTDLGLCHPRRLQRSTRPTCCCAIPIPAASRSTTSATIRSPAPPSWAASA